MLDAFCKFFNTVFESGIVPSCWTEALFALFIKTKGMPLPLLLPIIKIISCFGKLFTSVLNHRLNCYLRRTGRFSKGP